MTGFNTI